MDITPLIPEGRKVIESYGANRFQVSQETYTGSIIVTPHQVLSWDVKDFSEVTPESFAELTAPETRPEIVLIGCGSRMQLVPSEVRIHLKTFGIAVEPMDTGAACRTYNVLLGEGRRVAAALVALSER